MQIMQMKSNTANKTRRENVCYLRYSDLKYSDDLIVIYLSLYVSL